MKRIFSGALVACALVAGLAACGDDDDSGAQTNDDSSSEGDDGGEGRAAYVDAISAAAIADDEAFGELTDDDAQCFGEAYVDAIGLEELEANVTAQEIEENPSTDHSDWGIEITDEQGGEIYRAVVDCAPDAQRAIASVVADGFVEGFSGQTGTDIDVDEECLAEADPADIETFMGAAIAQGDAFAPDEEQATAMLDWMGSCIDLREAFVGAIASDPSLPEGVGECVSAGLDDQFIEDFWQLAFTAGDDPNAMQESPLMGELTDVMTGCAGQLQGPTTTAAAG